MAAHRYWRINITANAGDASFLAIAEIEMRATVGGADQCSGGTASASASDGASPPGNAVDNNNTTRWSTPSGTTTGWWKYDFGSAVEVVEYVIRAHPSTGGRSPKNWTLEYSDDDSTWTVADTRAALAYWGNGQARGFRCGQEFVGDAFAAWMVSVSSNDGDTNYLQIAEIELRTTAGGTDITGSGTASAASEVAGFEAGKAIDNNADTRWSTQSGTKSAWLRYQHPSDVSIAQYTIQAGTTGGRAPREWVLEGAAGDGIFFVRDARSGVTGWTAGETRTFDAPSSAATGTVAATESGADTAAFAGDVYVAGTVAATEAGSDTASLTGAVRIQGALAATESGSDTAAISGSALGVSSGALAATETGSDVAAFAGDVFVSGALAANEASADTASLSGVVRIYGALAATEGGSDSASIAGAALVTGELSATETGADVAALTGDVLVAGALSASESGADVASIAGAVPIAAVLSAAEAGSDVAAFSGAGISSGSLAATESGSDTAALAGSVLVQGALSCVESGTDTAAFAAVAPRAEGALAAQEAGSDSASMAGAVQIRGSAAITETDADTAIVVGRVLIAGAFNASESGQDAASLQGILATRVFSKLIATLTVRAALDARHSTRPTVSRGMVATATTVAAGFNTRESVAGNPSTTPAVGARPRLME